MPGIARFLLSPLAAIVLTTAMAAAATSSPHASSVQDLENRTRAALASVGSGEGTQTQETPKTTFHVEQPSRTNSRIIQDLTKAFAAYVTLHNIQCQAKSSNEPPEAVAGNPIADAVWRRLNEMTGGRISANLGLSTQERVSKQRLVAQKTIDARVTVGLFGPQYARARAAGRCR